MQRDQPVLDVGPGSHLGGAAHEHAHLTGAHLGEQLLLLDLRIGFMDEGNLLGRYAVGDELFPNVVIDIEGIFLRRFIRNEGFASALRSSRCTRALGRRNIAEDELCQPVFLPGFPDAQDVADTGVDLAGRIVRQQRIDETLIEAELAPVAGDLEHVVHRGIDLLIMDCRCALGERLHHFLLLRGGPDHDCFVFHIRRGKLKLIRRLDVRHFTEDVHQLRQVEELRKARARPIACTLRSQLNRRRGFAKGRCPAVKVRHAAALQSAILQISLHRIQLRHGIAHRRACGEDDAAPAGQLVHVAALHVHVAGFLRLGGRNARHVAHFGI